MPSWITWDCPDCGTPVRIRTNNRLQRKTNKCHNCSRPRGEEHSRYKAEGSFNTSLGRWVVTRNGRRLLRYRAVMEDHLGRPLRSDEHVHHINGDPTDDRLENLELVTASSHNGYHRGLDEQTVAQIFVLHQASLNQYEIAHRLGITQPSVSRRLSGREKAST